jgi:hypothetical protein
MLPDRDRANLSLPRTFSSRRPLKAVERSGATSVINDGRGRGAEMRFGEVDVPCRQEFRNLTSPP